MREKPSTFFILRNGRSVYVFRFYLNEPLINTFLCSCNRKIKPGFQKRTDFNFFNYARKQLQRFSYLFFDWCLEAVKEFSLKPSWKFENLRVKSNEILFFSSLFTKRYSMRIVLYFYGKLKLLEKEF